MNNLNIFKWYTVDQILKSILMFLIIAVIPVTGSIIATVNIVLLMIPSYYFVITGLAFVLVLIIAFSTYVFIMTLKNYKVVQEIDYKGLYLIIFLPISVIAFVLSYVIASIFI